MRCFPIFVLSVVELFSKLVSLNGKGYQLGLGNNLFSLVYQ